MHDNVPAPEGAPRLFDLVRCEDETLLPAFYYALRDTVVATDLQQVLFVLCVDVPTTFPFYMFAATGCAADHFPSSLSPGWKNCLSQGPPLGPCRHSEGSAPEPSCSVLQDKYSSKIHTSWV
jgi:hypothetical protein